MRKIALVFMLAVIAPSFVLGWLAVRSVRDQQIVVAQQQTLLYQGVADALAKEVRDYIAERQRDFSQTIESLRGAHSTVELSTQFDEFLRRQWHFAEVGFTVASDGSVLSPPLFGRPDALQFRLNNDRFLGSCESVQVYWNTPKGAVPVAVPSNELSGIEIAKRYDGAPLAAKSKYAVAKEVSYGPRLEPDEAEFKELVGSALEGTVARYLQNRLKLMFWYRSAREPDLIYGAQVNLSNVVAGLQAVVKTPGTVSADASAALLNEADRVVAGAAVGSPPFVSSAIGPVLPHWRIGIYLTSPEVLTRSARTLTLTLTLIVVVMISAIGLGSLLIVSDLRGQLTLARQKTDFVSNVSHELKTPLTSIRMFAELLSEGKVTDEHQRQQFLQIINTETARLSRLINNVLDFARMERKETEYRFARCDLRHIAVETLESYRTHLEAKGFKLTLRLPHEPLPVQCDADSLSQVFVNLLSNAEKYSGDGKEISVEVSREGQSATVRVSDRGMGVPRGAEERIFQQFYRAHDSLSSGIQGSGLGLTLARQIARAHRGEIRYEPRAGGGSSFVVTLPLDENA